MCVFSFWGNREQGRAHSTNKWCPPLMIIVCAQYSELSVQHTRVAGQSFVTPSSPFFRLYMNSLQRFLGKVVWMVWRGRARHPGPRPGSEYLAVEFLNVGCWLSHGDLALEHDGDFLAVSEHKLIPARCRDACHGMSKRGTHAIWSPTNQNVLACWSCWVWGGSFEKCCNFTSILRQPCIPGSY